MNAIRTAAFAAALAIASPAGAMTVADLANGNVFVKPPVDLDLGGVWTGQPARVDRIVAEKAQAATRQYFDADALVALGALAVAGGVFATLLGLGLHRRPIKDAYESEWRDSVFAVMQEDLTRFTENKSRRAA